MTGCDGLLPVIPDHDRHPMIAHDRLAAMVAQFTAASTPILHGAFTTCAKVHFGRLSSQR
jgi:hypothetical protein